MPAKIAWYSWLGLLILIPSLILNFFLFQKNKKNNQDIKVIGVIDGDTLVLEGKTRLRLRHIDAPELEFCGGQEAKQELENLVNGQSVAITEQILDQYGRPMSLIFVNDKFVNEAMLKTGWVRYHSDKTSQTDLLKETAAKAKQDHLGIYSPQCYQPNPADNPDYPDHPECIIKGNIDKNSDRRNYYFPGCPQYDFTIVEKDLGETWFCTEKQAQEAGFTRAKNCPQP